jgi:CheY-like chemotaxis protein
MRRVTFIYKKLAPRCGGKPHIVVIGTKPIRVIAMSPSPKGVARILVVDDDEGVCKVIVAMLADAGFAISTASSAWAALDMLDHDEFDLMVTDMMLPEGLDGLELVRYARARHPALKSLFVSGRDRGPIGDNPDLDEFVAKPFVGRELRLGTSRPQAAGAANGLLAHAACRIGHCRSQDPVLAYIPEFRGRLTAPKGGDLALPNFLGLSGQVVVFLREFVQTIARPPILSVQRQTA